MIMLFLYLIISSLIFVVINFGEDKRETTVLYRWLIPLGWLIVLIYLATSAIYYEKRKQNTSSSTSNQD